MRDFRKYLFSIYILLASPLLVLAQKDIVNTNSRVPGAIQADGKLVEWSDSLKNYDPASGLRYDIANDDTNLYVAIKTDNPIAIRKTFTFGLTFMVNKDGKKKEGPAITFPVIDPSSVRAVLQKTAQAKNKPSDLEVTRQLLSKVTGVRADGFKEILDGSISLNNEYGIRAAGSIDDKNIFRYELIIPLAYLEINKEFKDILAYNFRVNGAQRTVIQRNYSAYNRYRGGYGGYGYGYGGYGYGEPQYYKRTISETSEFWVRYKLVE